jgi:hypothetical protein
MESNILLRIYKTLGLKFNEEKFAMIKLMDSDITVTNNKETDFEIGEQIYVMKNGQELELAPPGMHVLSDGRKIRLDEASKLEEVMETTEDSRVATADDEVKNLKEELTKVEDTKGQILESDTFDVGEKVFVMDGDEAKPAPDGEYEFELRDTSGNENKIKIFVKDGVITERENVEMMKVNPPTIDEIMGMKEDISMMKVAMEEMLGYLRKKEESMSKEMSDIRKDFENFKKSPAAAPIKQERNVHQTFADWRFEQLKALRN